MSFTEQELAWLEQIIKQRTNSCLRLEVGLSATGTQELYVKYYEDVLKVNMRGCKDLFKPFRVTTFANTINLSCIINIIFSYLTRAEEYQGFKEDSHLRFSSHQSKSFKNGLLQKPVVDECFELLRQSVALQWPELKLSNTRPSTFVTCDVDSPYEYYLLSYQAFIRKLGGDLIRRKDLSEFKRTWSNYWRSMRADYSMDINNNFDWMMDVNEKAGNKMAFYFIVARNDPTFDAYYSIDEARIRQLMRRIYDRGHEVGLHVSYSAYKNAAAIKKEADKLRTVMDEEGIKQDKIGSRQHYLRWSTPETARCLEAAGISYDTTLGYADHAGFRCGTSHEFPMFDIENQKVLNLQQRPLILMEASVFSEQYMNKPYSEDTLAYMKSLKEACQRYGGTFTMLWHNNHFQTDRDRMFYQELIA